MDQGLYNFPKLRYWYKFDINKQEYFSLLDKEVFKNLKNTICLTYGYW